jgi:membrane protein YqaA with SNARE-associated domain
MNDVPNDVGELAGTPPRVNSPRWSGRARTAIIAFEILFIAGLLIWWLTSAAVRESRSLWVLFLYCFPSEFLIATVPHEPVLLYFAKFYSPLTVAWISVAGTVLTEAMNCTVFRYVADLKLTRKALATRGIQKAVRLFNKAPFAALWIAGVLPIPFYPFRFLVILARYPLLKYLLAVVTSRAPRFFLIALLAKAVRFPDSVILAITGVLLVAANLPIIGRLLKQRKPPREDARGL